MKARLFAITLSACALSLGIALAVQAEGLPPNWAQVNSNGFGTSANYSDYALSAFGGNLYAGTCNDSGAQVWRRTATNWSPVITNGFGSANTVCINALYAFGSYQYAATVDTVAGGEVFRSSNGVNWTRVVTAGFGYPAINNEVTGFAALTGTLYAGTASYLSSAGADIWKSTDGLSWTRDISNGFGDSANNGMYGMEVFNGYLYVGTGNATGAELWRTRGAGWSPVETAGFGNSSNLAVSALAAFNGYLYAGTRNPTQGGELWRSSNGINWTPVFTGGLGSIANGRLYGLIVFDSQLFMVFTNVSTGAEVWRSANGTSWERLIEHGWGDSNNQFADYFDKGAAILNGGLYIAASNNLGAEVWLYRPQVDTAYVAPGGACGGASPCFAAIQPAVDAAFDLDVIKVTAGTYTDLSARPRRDTLTTGLITQVVYLSKTVTIEGGYSTTDWSTTDPVVHPTTLNAQRKGRGLYITGDINPTIAGLQITGGATDENGGGVDIWHARATLRNNLVYSNTAAFGGGISTWESGDNHLFGTTITANKILSNTAEQGGGVALGKDVVAFSDNVIRANNGSVSGSSSGRAGGVLVFIGGGTFERNLIAQNHTDGYAAGMHVHMGDVTLINNAIIDNHLDISSETDGGVSFQSSTARLLHNTVARNTGGALANGIAIAGDYYASTITLTNTLVAGQPVGIYAGANSTTTIDAVLWYSTPVTVSKDAAAIVTVRHSYTGDPLFSADGYHLSWGSAALDKGISAGVTNDIDGQARPWGAGSDLGADEYHPYAACLPIVRKP